MFLLFYGVKVTIYWLNVPLLMLLELIFIFSVASLVAAIVPFIPDLRLIVTSLMQMLFFLSGIFYDLSRMPAEIREYFVYNPVAVFIDSYRAVMLKSTPPDWSLIGLVAAITLVLFCIVILVYRRVDRVFPRVIG